MVRIDSEPRWKTSSATWEGGFEQSSSAEQEIGLVVESGHGDVVEVANGCPGAAQQGVGTTGAEIHHDLLGGRPISGLAHAESEETQVSQRPKGETTGVATQTKLTGLKAKIWSS